MAGGAAREVEFHHGYGFDPSCGMDLAALKAIRPPGAPDGYDEFWSDAYAAAMKIDAAPSLTTSPLHHERWHVLDITYRSTRSFDIRGWLLLPRQGKVKRGLVVGHGYDGRTAPDFDFPADNTAILFPCFRGLSLSARPPVSSNPLWHVLHDIDKPRDYILRGCVEDLWLAVSTLVALYPRVSGRIGYSGISFGGGIGALAIPYDARIDRGHLALPTFGAQRMRLELPSIGSAAAVQMYERRHHNAMATLQYYDAAVSATRIRVPMLVALALFDPSVAPPCQFAIGNAISKKLCKTVILPAGHFDYPQKEENESALKLALGTFFKAK